jgi:hypothetical protein
MSAYNEGHHTLLCINHGTFRYNSELGPELIAAATIRHYMDYHIALCADDTIPSLAPAGYDEFADTMNELDNSGFGWARLDEHGAIIWNDEHEFATAEDFCVLDRDLDPRVYLRAGEAAISNVELLDYRRLKDAETKNNVKWRMKRIDERDEKERNAGSVQISADVFAKKHKLLQRSVNEASKKARIDEGAAPEDGEVRDPPAGDTPMNIDSGDAAGPSGIA